MQSQHQEKQDYLRDEEVDFSFLYRKARGAFEKAGNGISYVMQIIKKRWLLLTVAFLLGLSVGLVAYLYAKPFYKSTMTLVMSTIRNEFVEDQLNTLAEMVKEDNVEAVANSLNISVEEASQIRSMEFANLDKEKIAEDSVAIGSPFRIAMTLYDNELFSTMQPALINYMEENPYFARQKSITMRQYQNMINKLKSQIASIDSITVAAVNPRGPVNGFVYGEALDPTNLYKEGTGLYEQQVELEANLERLENTQVVKGFYPRSRPSGPNLIKYILLGGAVFFLFGLVVALVAEKK